MAICGALKLGRIPYGCYSKFDGGTKRWLGLAEGGYSNLLGGTLYPAGYCSDYEVGIL